MLTYLAASGVGKIGIVDFDKVEISNLNRQTLFNPNDIGKFKVNQAKKVINKINKKIKIITYKKKLTSKNIKKILNKFDIICDGTDNYNTRYLINKNRKTDTLNFWFKGDKMDSLKFAIKEKDTGIESSGICFFSQAETSSWLMPSINNLSSRLNPK